MERFVDILTEVKSGVTKKTANKKDEITIAKAMLNDTEFEVGVYDNTGKVDVYNPAKDFRGMLTNVVSSTTKISSKEAAELVADYMITNADAETMVNVSKEFVNSYLHTGRKLNLGKRENMSASLILEHKQSCTRRVPNTDGTVVTPEYDKVKCSSPCPKWNKK